MSFLNDANLLVKKIFVTVIVYLVPVTIVVGGLLLTEHVLKKPSQAEQIERTPLKPE